MRTVLYILLILMLLSCGTTEEYVYDSYTVTIRKEGKITVTGKALDAKAGAVVETADSDIYYVDGYSHWEESHYGKQVEVSGKLKIRETVITDTSVIIQYAPRMQIIMHPRVRIISE